MMLPLGRDPCAWPYQVAAGPSPHCLPGTSHRKGLQVSGTSLCSRPAGDRDRPGTSVWPCPGACDPLPGRGRPRSLPGETGLGTRAP